MEFVSIKCYMQNADDLCIISLSSAGLQQLLVQCDDYCRKHSITFNVSKSISMFFKSAVNRKCDTTDLFLSSKAIDFVQETKYLGVMLNSQLRTSIDVYRPTRKFYAQANMLLRTFRYFYFDVKCMLFR